MKPVIYLPKSAAREARASGRWQSAVPDWVTGKTDVITGEHAEKALAVVVHADSPTELPTVVVGGGAHWTNDLLEFAERIREEDRANADQIAAERKEAVERKREEIHDFETAKIEHARRNPVTSPFIPEHEKRLY